MLRDTPPAIVVGTTLGPYRVRAAAGQGTFGEVYEAVDTGNGERVALKVLRTRDSYALSDFKNELRRLREVTHPGIVVADEILAVDDTLCLVMPFVPGEPFTRALAAVAGTKGPLRDEERTRRIIVNLLDALDALHRVDLLHLDLKPDNVLVTEEDAVYVLDFGLSRHRQELAAQREESFVGTPRYMAPEQLSWGNLGPATDLYAVGLMLYEALTGAPPFGERGSTSPLTRVLGRPASAVTLRPEIEGLSALMDTIFTPNPSERPSLREVASRLGERPSEGVEHVAPAEPASVVRLAGELGPAWDRTREGTPSLVLIAGVDDAREQAALRQLVSDGMRDAFIVEGRCLPLESLPYKALDSMVDQLWRRLERTPEAIQRLRASQHVAALAELFPVLGGVQPAPLLAAESASRRMSARRGFAELVAALARERPLVLVIHDAHLGDADSVDLLDAILSAPDAPRLVVVLGFRASERATSRLLCELEDRVRRGVRFPVQRLDAQATPSAPTSLASRLAAETPTVLEFLSHVAVAERPISLEALAALLPVPARAELRRLVVAELIAVSLDARGRRQVECRDRQVAQAILGGLDADRRAAIHSELASRSIALGDDPGTIAFHCLAVGRHDEARQYALMAADRAERARAHAASADLLELAVRAGDDSVATRRRHAEALVACGRHREAAAALVALSERSEPGGSHDGTHERLKAAEVLLQSGHFAEGMALIEPLLRRHGIALPASSWKKTGTLLGHATWLAIAGRRAAANGRHTHEQAPSEALSLQSDLAWAVGKSLVFVDPLVGIGVLFTSLRAAKGDPRRFARAAGPLAAFVLGNVPGLKGMARRWVEAIEALDDEPYFKGVSHLWRALKALGTSELGVALAAAVEAMDQLETDPRASWERVQAASYAARALINRGHYHSALALVESHTIDADLRGDLGAKIALDTYRPMASLAAGRVAETRANCQWLLDSWLPDRYAPHTFYALRGLVLADVMDGEPERAAGRIVASRKAFTKAGGYRFPFSRFDHDLLEARVVMTLGRVAPGGWPLDRLIKRLEALPNDEARGHAQLLRAVVCLKQGARDEALTLLSRANAHLERCEVDLEGEAARWLRARLTHDEDAAASARVKMVRLGVSDPERWMEVIVPGALAAT